MICQCEDRPACGCDADVYQPYDQEPREYGGSHDPRCECSKCVDDGTTCQICGEEWSEDDDEDDEVQGFHAGCAEVAE